MSKKGSAAINRPELDVKYIRERDLPPESRGIAVPDLLGTWCKPRCSPTISGIQLFNINHLEIPTKAAVVDFGAVNSARFHSLQ
jgi:hypothetical protein